MSILFRPLHLLFAVIPQIAIFYDLTHGYRDLANYYSTFTILMNTIATVMFLILFIVGPKYKAAWIDSLRGAVTGYLLVLGAIYFVLLRNLPDDPTAPTIPLVNHTLHYLMQGIAFFDWIAFPPKNRLAISNFVKWLLFPLAFVAYTLVRGRIVIWYPYPFLDPVNGYLPMVPTLATMVVAGLVLSVLIILLGNELMLKKRNG